MNEAGAGPVRDIILIGGSAGSIEVLLQIVKLLPFDFPAAIFIVVHTSAQGPGLLPRVLGRAGEMPALYPASGDSFHPGHIYVARPDHHMTLGPENTILVRRGARENGSRPAIDPLFRSAAAGGYGPRSIAVVLSGYLDDGSAGLYAVRRRGGLGIVHDPTDAMVQDMPRRALDYAGADYVLPAAKIAGKLGELVNGAGKKVVTMKKQERARAARSQESHENDRPNAYTAAPEESTEGTPSAFACPDCHGVLWEIKEGAGVRYRCRTGHAYSEATLNEELSSAAESALWAAMRALEEKASMSRRMSESFAGPVHWKRRHQEQAITYAKHAELVRRMILGEPPAVEHLTASEERDENVS